ncbi:MAG: hypothetical protein NT177_08385 [Chloroflexi bacterium]|nr:hypothetical protein [Chloroflexota bacterium]
MVIIVLASGCQACAPDPLQGGVKVYSGNKGEEPEQPSQVLPPPTPQTVPPVDTTERQVTVTDANSVFSIGLPPGYREERRVSTQKPVDFWFEYLTPEMSLTVNGIPVEIPVRRGTGKTGFTSNVTGFSYVMVNLSNQYLSYNLRVVPSKPGELVPMVTRETWTAP